ncbi:MAG TPA: PEP-CTERM sorting domain-containing protein [Thiobacillus sp.]|nr:PEP-CTERM sorting domain-containing protein [Thiobacillus sp.]
MKMKLIALAAMLVASGAQANIADSNDRAKTADESGDLFSHVFSESQNATYTVDLGLSLNQFMAGNVNAAGIKLVWDLDDNAFIDMSSVDSGITITQTLNYGDIWDTFATDAVIGASDLSFEVKAMDGLPSALAPTGANQYLSTTNSDSIAATNSQVFSMDNWDAIIIAANEDQTNSTHGGDLSIAGANMFDLGDFDNVSYLEGGLNWKGAVNFSTASFSITDELYFWYVTNSSASGAFEASYTTLAGFWTFDPETAQLTYATAPVPEAETYAMMLAGLGLVGFMAARRRKAA